MPSIKSITLNLISLLFFATTITAQEFNNTIQITAASTDNQNNTYTIGQFQGTVNFNFPGEEEHQLKAIKNSDIFIQKTDVRGNLIWVKQLITTSTSTIIEVSIDAEDNLYILGMFEQVIDLDPSNNTHILASSNQPAFFVQQLDPQGNLLNAHQVNSNNLTSISFLIENVLEIEPIQQRYRPTFSLGMDN
ncbi:MAG: hypothetical protein GY810_04350 [Aureispira sp.]|nr:hypothetical protein [Aureispira sp.]